MKILHVIVGLDAGGAERTLERLVKSHAGDERFEHSVVSLTDIGTVGTALRRQGIDVISLGMRSFASTATALWKLRGIMRRRKPDVVQTWMYHADLIGGVAARLAGVRRIIWGIHTTDIMRGTARSTAVVRKVCAWLSWSVPSTIVCVAEAARDAHVAVGYDPRRMLIIPNGFDIDFLKRDEQARARIREEYSWNESQTVVGCVARFNNYKDHANLINAVGMIAEKAPDLRVLLVGPGIVDTNRELMRLIRGTPRPDVFTLLGERDDVVACLSAMDVFCLPSRSEAFPIALGEAMATELPCVVTDVGDSALLVGDTGLVVPREAPAALAEALLQVLQMSAVERRALGVRARNRIADQFSMKKTQRRFEELYVAPTSPRNGGRFDVAVVGTNR